MFNFLLLLMHTLIANATIETRDIKYEVGGKSFTGVLSWKKNSKNTMPGVLIVHEWWGLNEYVRSRAKQLAEEGYIAFALDMYGNAEQAHNPKQAQKLMGNVHGDWDLAQKRFEKALELLKKNPQVKTAKIAAIGYCFGGGVVLEMAKRGVNLQGVVSFHGILNTPTLPKKNKINTRVLVLNGASDTMVPSAEIQKFKKEMDLAEVKYKFVNYPNAKHAFTNPQADKIGKIHNIEIAYNREADLASWSEMKGFFDDIF